MTKQLKHLHVYIVHQFATVAPNGRRGAIINTEHKILGVYTDKELAQAHRLNIQMRMEDIINGPYIAVTKHVVRGRNSKLLGIFQTKGWKITAGNPKGQELFNSEDFL